MLVLFYLKRVPHPYLQLPELYFRIAAKAVNLVADVIFKALNILRVEANIPLISIRLQTVRRS